MFMLVEADGEIGLQEMDGGRTAAGGFFHAEVRFGNDACVVENVGQAGGPAVGALGHGPIAIFDGSDILLLIKSLVPGGDEMARLVRRKLGSKIDESIERDALHGATDEVF